MSKVYVVQALGFGDREDAFYNMGVYSTKAQANKALKEMEAEWAEDDLEDVETNIEEWELDA